MTQQPLVFAVHGDSAERISHFLAVNLDRYPGCRRHLK
jgi:hypothetical protein